MTCEFSAAIYGHSCPEILGAITNVLRGVGMNVGATTRQEELFAREVCRRFDLERVRFANSGTEANLHALAAAKLFTGKRRVVAFSGGYHGAVLTFSGGVPAANNVDIDDWIIANYNDLDSARAAIQSDGVAAVIIEAMQGAGGCFPATQDFLSGVRKAAAESGVVFILDEVMTSRMSAGGLAQVYNLDADLKTYGKWLGGGLAFGAFGGRADIMAIFDPRLRSSVSHSGTFNNNTLVTLVGHAGMTSVYTPHNAELHTRAGDRFREALNEATKGTRVCFTGIGSCMALHITRDGVRDIRSGSGLDEIHELKELFWFEMIEQGFWVTRRGFISLIWGTPDSELERFVDAVKKFVSDYKEFLAL